MCQGVEQYWFTWSQWWASQHYGVDGFLGLADVDGPFLRGEAFNGGKHRRWHRFLGTGWLGSPTVRPQGVLCSLWSPRTTWGWGWISGDSPDSLASRVVFSENDNSHYVGLYRHGGHNTPRLLVPLGWKGAASGAW